MKVFTLYFLASYGALWFTMFIIAFVTQSRIDTGQFGWYGFPVLSVIFGLFIYKLQANRQQEKDHLAKEIAELRAAIEKLNPNDKWDKRV